METSEDKIQAMVDITKRIQILYELSDEDIGEILDRIQQRIKKDKQVKEVNNGNKQNKISR